MPNGLTFPEGLVGDITTENFGLADDGTVVLLDRGRTIWLDDPDFDPCTPQQCPVLAR